MKFLKLILFIVVVVGVVAGIILIPDIDQDKGKIQPGTPTYSKIENKINNIWSGDKPWNMESYKQALSIINSYNKELSHTAYDNLRHTNALLAMDAIHNDIMAEFSKCECSSGKVKALNEAAITLNKDGVNQLQDNIKLKECNNTYNLYAAIINFGKESFALNSGFKVEKGTFNSFDDYKTKKLKQRDAYKSNSLYSKISNINEVNNALTRVEGQLNIQAGKYPGRVADNIMDAFDKVDYTTENLELYQKAIKYYSNRYSIPDKLRKHNKEFEAKVEEQKNYREEI